MKRAKNFFFALGAIMASGYPEHIKAKFSLVEKIVDFGQSVVNLVNPSAYRMDHQKDFEYRADVDNYMSTKYIQSSKENKWIDDLKKSSDAFKTERIDTITYLSHYWQDCLNYDAKAQNTPISLDDMVKKVGTFLDHAFSDHATANGGPSFANNIVRGEVMAATLGIGNVLTTNSAVNENKQKDKRADMLRVIVEKQKAKEQRKLHEAMANAVPK